MTPSREDLTRLYGGMSDDRLTDLAIHETDQLTPEALSVLQQEVRRRGLSERLESAIDVQTRHITTDEHDQLLRRFRQLPCPLCGAGGHLLNAVTVATTRSMLAATTYETQLVVGCPDCMLVAVRKAHRITLAAAGGAFPGGLCAAFRLSRRTQRPARQPDNLSLPRSCVSTSLEIAVQ